MSQRHPHKVVVVDDDAIVRESLRLCLEQDGFEAKAVADAAKALDVIRAEKPALAVLDLYMPGLDGREIARALKADPETAGIAIVFFTASSEPVDVVTGLDAGAVEYIAKPIDAEVLVNKIRAILKLPPKSGQ